MNVAIFCLVVAITDGDTIRAKCDGIPEQVKVRLSDIDAPEKNQPWGNRSKQALSSLCYMKQAIITPQTNDRYGRLVARVECAGQDANAAKVRAGMAWVYRKYSRDTALLDLESAARNGGIGLWGDSDPVPPWEWRKK